MGRVELMAEVVYYTSEKQRQRNKDLLAAADIAADDDTAGVDADVDILGNMVDVAAFDDYYSAVGVGVGVAAAALVAAAADGYFDATLADL